MVLLSLFALGILVIDLMLPKEWKQVNALTAMTGLVFSAAAVGKLHFAYRAAEQRGELGWRVSKVGCLLEVPLRLGGGAE